MRRYSNIAVATTITSAIDATQTTIPLAAVTGWIVPGAGDSSLAQIDGEIIEYTGVSGLSFTGCLRGVDGTTAASHASGAAVVHVGSAADLELIQSKVPIASGVGVVVHGDVAATARPADYAVIHWYGTVEPTAALDNDIWYDTTP